MFLIRGTTIAVLLLFLMLGLSPLVTSTAAEEAIWVQLDDMPVALAEFSYASLPDGRVFVSMGGDLMNEVSKQTWLFDSKADAWDEVNSSPFGYVGASAVAMPDGKVYIFGGAYMDINIMAQEKVLIYDSFTDTWAFGVDIPESVIYLEAVALDDERILLIGGLVLPIIEPVKDCWIYNTEREEFDVAATLPSSRATGVAAISGSSVYYAGGADLSTVAQEEVFKYDIPTGSWELAGRMPEGRFYDNGALGDDGLLYMYGGKTGATTDHTGTGTMRVVDLEDCTFIDVPEPPHAVKAGGVLTTDDGRFIFMGGIKGSDPVASVYSLNIFSKDSWLGADSSAPGEGVRLYAQVDVSLVDYETLNAEVYLVKDNVTYASYHLEAMNSGVASTFIAVPEDLSPGEYQLMIAEVDIGVGVRSDIEFEPLTLTITNAPSPTDRIGELQDQLNDTQQELAEVQGALDELKEASDAKMDAMIGYIILIAVIAGLVISLLVLIRKK